MSILIKGMAMPERCIDCELCTLKVMGAHRTTCIICRHNGEEIALHGRREDCPLVELPPHGRLIDADELRGWYDFHSYDVDDDDFLTEEKFDKLMVATAVVRQNIDDAPTIIESEE